MENSFKNLIERFGVPKIIVPNTPRILAQRGSYLTVGKNPETPAAPSDVIYHRRFQFGDSEFLGVYSRIETDLEREKELLEHLKTQELKPVEFVYSYQKNRSSGVSENKAAIATDADAAPVSRRELLEAISEKRLIWACGWSSMGDAYRTFAF
jgi:hypothetical protein